MRSTIAILATQVTFALALIGQSASGNTYVGSRVCGTCHLEIGRAFYKNPHFKSIAAENKPPEETGCEGCHGPGANHLRAGGGQDTIRAFSQFTAAETVDTCLTCHGGDIPRANIRTSQHILSGMACTSCHSIHNSTPSTSLLRQPQVELCSGCHRAVAAEFSLPFKHRVQEGFMSCTDCHNPHGTPSPTWTIAPTSRLVATGQVNEQPCMNCHNEVRGPFLFEHPAVRVSGCQSCHQPHGSTNSRLLRRPVVFPLCLECHNGGDSFGRQSNGVQVQSSRHNLSEPLYQNCTACHVRVHGSNADVNFLR